MLDEAMAGNMKPTGTYKVVDGDSFRLRGQRIVHRAQRNLKNIFKFWEMTMDAVRSFRNFQTARHPWPFISKMTARFARLPFPLGDVPPFRARRPATVHIQSYHSVHAPFFSCFRILSRIHHSVRRPLPAQLNPPVPRRYVVAIARIYPSPAYITRHPFIIHWPYAATSRTQPPSVSSILVSFPLHESKAPARHLTYSYNMIYVLHPSMLPQIAVHVYTPCRQPSGPAINCCLYRPKYILYRQHSCATVVRSKISIVHCAHNPFQHQPFTPPCSVPLLD